MCKTSRRSSSGDGGDGQSQQVATLRHTVLAVISLEESWLHTGKKTVWPPYFSELNLFNS
jgi:hypothetical protein